MSNLAGRTAIVTGGGQGIGRGIAMALARAGARVVIFGRTERTLRAAQDDIAAFGGTAVPVVGDVASKDDRERLVKETLDQFGAINILVNNAAFIPHGDVLTIKEHVIERAWQTGPVASLMLMRLCHPHLKGGGCIINLSTAQALNPRPGSSIYAATKAALNLFSRSAAVEWGSDGIRVNTIMPFGESEAVKAFFTSDPAMLRRRRWPPCRSAGSATPNSISVERWYFLVSEESRYLTGAALPLDGGTAYLR